MFSIAFVQEPEVPAVVPVPTPCRQTSGTNGERVDTPPIPAGPQPGQKVEAEVPPDGGLKSEPAVPAAVAEDPALTDRKACVLYFVPNAPND